MTFTPTTEQQAAIDLAATRKDLTIEALAGCGKTTTLEQIGRSTHRQGLYVSFGKAIVVDAESRMPKNVACSTAHSLAYKAIGYKYRARLNGPRQLYREVSNILGIHGPLHIEVDETLVELSSGEQVHAIKTAVDRFCTGGEDTIQPWHFEVPDLLQPWAKGYRKAVCDALMPKAEFYWEELQKPKGKIRFDHNHYLKMWQLTKPELKCEFLMFDEAQDANGVMLAIVLNQSCQKIFVGDTYQQIYSWNGAVNAMSKTGGNRCYLTESWRFGQGIADVANLMLSQLNAEAFLKGRGSESTIAPLNEVDTVLYRTNGACLGMMINAHDLDMSYRLVGGVAALRSFTEAAAKMIRHQKPCHPELNCFQTWSDVLNFANTPEGADGDLPRLVKMIERNGCKKILSVCDSSVEANQDPDITISTAHKAKGCEWSRVQIGGDFSPEPSLEEKRLLYVAATRAKRELDHTAVKGLFDKSLSQKV